MNLNRTFAVAAVLVAGGTLTPAAFAQTATPFPDVPAKHWAAPSIAKLMQAGIITGNFVQFPQSAQAGKPVAKPAPTAYQGNKPITRYEAAVLLYRFVQYMERADRQRKSNTGAMANPLARPTDGKEAIIGLVAGGYLPKTSPLVQMKYRGRNVVDVTVTANMFADALAQVVTRIQEKKTPISKDSELDIARPVPDAGSPGRTR